MNRIEVKIDNLDTAKFDSSDFANTWGTQITDHEKRIRVLERYTFIGFGLLIALQFIIPFVVKFFSK